MLKTFNAETGHNKTAAIPCFGFWEIGLKERKKQCKGRLGVFGISDAMCYDKVQCVTMNIASVLMINDCKSSKEKCILKEIAMRCS